VSERHRPGCSSSSRQRGRTSDRNGSDFGAGSQSIESTDILGMTSGHLSSVVSAPNLSVRKLRAGFAITSTKPWRAAARWPVARDRGYVEYIRMNQYYDEYHSLGCPAGAIQPSLFMVTNCVRAVIGDRGAISLARELACQTNDVCSTIPVAGAAVHACSHHCVFVDYRSRKPNPINTSRYDVGMEKSVTTGFNSSPVLCLRPCSWSSTGSGVPLSVGRRAGRLPLFAVFGRDHFVLV